MKKSIVWVMLLPMVMTLTSCKKRQEVDPDAGKTIVILYENDVHCGVSGYTKIAGLRNAINATDTARCIVVSSGDFIQGGNWGALSSGEYIIDMMNAVGYDAVTIGNHEFDYGGARLINLMNKLNAPVTCVNFSNYNSTEQMYKPYVMTKVCGKKIAFVGVVTPSTLSSEYYSFYDSLGAQIYDLYPDQYITLTQNAVDQARSAGANYVILLSHLGEQDENYSSVDLISKTTGIDEVLDGHTHSVIADSFAINKNNDTIHFTQTGTQFANIGKLTIRNGKLHTELLAAASVNYNDSRVDAVSDSIQKLVSATTDEVLGTSDHALTIYDESGNRLVRKQECTAGNFCADAYRYCMGAQIGLSNGGGVRADLPAGTVTYGNLVSVNPFFNDLEAREVKGSQLLALLNDCYSLLPKENGSFMQVSGIRVVISMADSVPSVKSVQVEGADGTYSDLVYEQTYTVASSSYVFGLITAVSECKVVSTTLLKDAGALRRYFTEALHGDMTGHYLATEGRITIQ